MKFSTKIPYFLATALLTLAEHGADASGCCTWGSWSTCPKWTQLSSDSCQLTANGCKKCSGTWIIINEDPPSGKSFSNGIALPCCGWNGKGCEQPRKLRCHAKEVTCINACEGRWYVDEGEPTNSPSEHATVSSEAPSVFPSISIEPSTNFPTVFPSISNEPSGNSEAPSVIPSISNEPSGNSDFPSVFPSISIEPSTNFPSVFPSISNEPSINSDFPSVFPSISNEPSGSSDAPSVFPSISIEPSDTDTARPSSTSVDHAGPPPLWE